MAVYPESPRPRQITPLPFNRASITSQFDGGAISTRTKYLRRRVVQLQLAYTVRFNEYSVLLDFFAETAQSVLPFEFYYPVPHAIANVFVGSPAQMSFYYPHGYQTGEQVYIRNNAALDGTYTITRLNANNVTVDGTSVGTAAAGGHSGRYFPKMRVTGDTFGPFASQRGPHGLAAAHPVPGLTRAGAYVSFSVILEETW